MTHSNNDMVLRAIRIAEYAHRNRPEGPHHRKAPKGEDRPYSFIHLAEVAWMLTDAGCDHEVIAAGYLHDIMEDCGYSGDQLDRAIGSRRARELVEWVTELYEGSGKKDPLGGPQPALSESYQERPR